MEDDSRWFFIFMCVLVFIVMSCVMIRSYQSKDAEREIELEAIRAGLVQTVQDGSTIWVKPEVTSAPLED